MPATEISFKSLSIVLRASLLCIDFSKTFEVFTGALRAFITSLHFGNQTSENQEVQRLSCLEYEDYVGHGIQHM